MGRCSSSAGSGAGFGGPAREVASRRFRINPDKKAVGLWLGVSLAGFIVIGLAITIGISNQVNEGFVSEFSDVKGRYELETELDPDSNDYYVVASVRGDTGKSRITSAVVNIRGVDGDRSKILEAGGSRSVDCEVLRYCKEQILKGFSVKNGGVYNIHVDAFTTVDQVEILRLKLHSDRGVFLYVMFVLPGMVLLFAGIFMATFSLARSGYRDFLNRIKRSFFP